MDKKRAAGWKTLVLLQLLTLGPGGVIGWLTSRDTAFYQSLNKPGFAPPGWLFPVVWSLLYAAMALAMWLVLRSNAGNKRMLLSIYFVQLAVNLLWPVIFFLQQALGLAFVWLVLLAGLVLLMLIRFFRHSKTAGWLIVPYLLWIVFAGVLNFILAQMN